MSRPLLDLVKAYGDACRELDGDGSGEDELAEAETRIGQIRELVKSIDCGNAQCERIDCESARMTLALLDGAS